MLSKTAFYALLMTILLPFFAHAQEYHFLTKENKNHRQEVKACAKMGSKHKVDMNLCLNDGLLKKSIKYYWKTDGDVTKAIGCETVTESISPFAVLQDNLPMTECVNHAPIASFEWTQSDNGEISGCTATAEYKGLKVPVTDLNLCLEKMSDQITCRLVVDQDSNTAIAVKFLAKGQEVTLPADLAANRCQLGKSAFDDAVFSKNGQIDKRSREDIIYAWDKVQGSRCLMIAEDSLRTVGTAPSEQCTDAVLSVDKNGKPYFAEQIRRASFRQILKSDKATEMIKDFGASCVAAINKVTQRGGSLKSRILQKAIVPFKSIQMKSGVQDDTFYHWTSDRGLFDLFRLDTLGGTKASARALKEHLYDQIFTFLRTRDLKDQQRYGSWFRVFYVAEDPVSSSQFGNRSIEFRIDMKAKTIPYDRTLWKSAVQEVAVKYPEVAANCDISLSTETMSEVYISNIFYPIAEDSGVDIIDYHDHSWFQVLSPNIFKSVRAK